MGQHVQSSTEVHAHERAAITEAAERVGDGSQFTPDDFRQLNYAERVALRQASPQTYDALMAGRKPGEAWHPGQGQGVAR